MHVDYEAALEMTGLDTLYDRRVDTDRCLLPKSIKQERNQKLFPLNSNLGSISTRHSERVEVNFATTEAYRNSKFLSARDY